MKKHLDMIHGGPRAFQRRGEKEENKKNRGKHGEELR